MAVVTENNQVKYVGNGSTSTPYVIPFMFFENAHIVVYVDGVQLGGGDFTVSGAGDEEGGSFTTTAAYTSEQQVTVARLVPFTQPFDYSEGGRLPAKTLEKNFDWLTMAIQQLIGDQSKLLNRSLRFPIVEPSANNTELPTPAARKDTVIYFNQTTGVLETIRIDQLAQRMLVILGAEAVLPQRVIEVTDDYTLTAEESNALIRINSTEDITITLPATGEEFDQTFGCIFQRIGTGAVTFAPASGVIIDSDYLRVFGRYTGVSCHWVGVDRWTIYGDLY